ncbi:MAG: peptidylprolyl isomerase [Chthoniobacterales bacterium]|nr:MAG: peptidylprolyl isomerase [Chthoniobacterales bacterium]
MIRPFFLGLLVAATLLVSPLCRGALAAEEEAKVIDGIAAIVNGEVITYSQVRGVSAPRERLLRSQFTGDELAKQIKEARDLALKDLIDRQLIVQAFRKEKYELPGYFVEQRVQDIIREDFGGDRNTFIKTLQAQNYSLSEFKKMEMDKIIVQAMRGKNVKPVTMISPTKINEYYAKHKAEFTSKEQVKLRLIMIPTHAAEGNAAAQKAIAEEILGKLADGAPFDRMAQMYSEDSTRDLGGDWGWVERKTLAGPLEKVAFNLPTGRVSHVIELGPNYYILKVEEKRGGDTPSLAKMRPEIEKKLMQEESQRQQELWLAGLRQKAYIRTF